MAILIDSGTTGAIGGILIPEAGATVIVSGTFNGASVSITLEDDAGLRPAHVHSFASPGAIRLEAGNTYATIKIEGGDSPSIDVGVT